MKLRAHLPAWAAILYLFPFTSGQVAVSQVSPAQNATPTIEVNVNRIWVPVVVCDRQGRAVGDLKKEDFQVFDNDQPRSVSGFTVEQRTAHVAGADTSAANSAGPAPANSRRFLVFLFDDLHLSAEDLVYVQKSGTKALDSTLAGSDIAAVVSTSGKTNSGLTNDRTKLDAAIMGLHAMGIYKSNAAECPRIGYYQADLIENKRDSAAMVEATQQVFDCNPALNPKSDYAVAERQADAAAMRVQMVSVQDVLSTYAAIHEFVRRMATLPGQRSMILVSPGFLPLAQEAVAEESKLIDFAAQSNVTISALDARGLYTTSMTASEDSKGSLQQQADYRRSSMNREETAMAELADGTGGTFFHNSNDLDAGFKLLTQVPEYVYMIELSLDNVKQDGSYHRLKVKVDRDGTELQVRRGYFVPRPEKHKK